jgi:Sulfotransferase family
MSHGEPPPSPPLRIIYLAGAKNCGSTLLDAILGNAPRAHSLGEVGGFHRYRADAACACRQPPAACCGCRGVMDVLDPDDSGEFARVSRLPLKERRIHWTVLGTRTRRRYAELADLAFERVAATTRSSVLIDSSKNASRAAALLHDSRFDVRVIHLVRDGRGYLRSRRSRAAADGTRHIAAFAMTSWLAKNMLIGALLASRPASGRHLLCRYEDLLTDPGATLQRIGEFAGLDTSDLAEQATQPPGVGRDHLFEPARRTDYRRVLLDPSRLASQLETPARNLRFWVLGGFLSALWGYDRRQSYLART